MGKNKRPGSLLSGLPDFVLSSLREAASTSEGTLAGNKRPTESETHARPQARAAKKQKLEGGLLGPGWERYDATDVVPFYKREKDVPEELKKYFYQRRRYFSLYDRGCLLDAEGWYSVTPEAVADVVAERCRCGTVVDAFCGVGGNAIAFARTCERVIAMDTSETRLRLARHNAVLYGVQDRIEFLLADYVAFAHAYLCLPAPARGAVDVVFLSPPWGGIDYMASPPQKGTCEDGDGEPSPDDGSYSLDRIKPLPGAELFRLTRRITPHVAFYLPKHVNLQEVSDLLPRPAGDEMIEVQEAWMGNKLKAVTCYFGGLVEGQEHLISF